MDVEINRVHDVEPLDLNPVTVKSVQAVAPVAVHLKEVNQVAPLSIESVRVDRVANVDPLHVDRLNVTRLPIVNLAVQQVPEVALSVGRVPPIAISIQQSFELTSDYTARARLLGVEVLRMRLTGTTRVAPRSCARREHAHSHERSAPDVAAVGNPAIPSRVEERYAVATRTPDAWTPRFSFHAARSGG